MTTKFEPIEYAVPAAPYMLYNGTNSAEILTALTEGAGPDTTPSIVSEDEDGALTVFPGADVNPNYVVNVGDHVAIGGLGGVVPAANWADFIIKA